MLWSSFVMRSTLSFSLTLPGPCQSASYGSAHAGRTALRSESDHPLHDMKCFWRLSLFFAVIVFALVGHFRRNKPRGENRKWKRWKVTLSVVTKLVLVMWKEKWTEQKKSKWKNEKKELQKEKSSQPTCGKISCPLYLQCQNSPWGGSLEQTLCWARGKETDDTGHPSSILIHLSGWCQ